MVEIRTITTSREIDRFIDFRTELYKDDPCAVPYLFMDEKDTLSKDRNPSFDFCDAEYYMAFRDGKAVGRVAAIINRKANKRWNQKCVRFGWLDFIDDRAVSMALINKVCEYGLAHGMDTIIGPMGFIDLEREGLLVEGFDTMATMHANHNFPYYREHLEAMGFSKDNDWVQQLVTVPAEVPEKFAKITSMIGRRYNLHAVKLTKRELMKEGYGHKFFHVLNKCYEDLYEFSELNEKQIDKMVKDYLGLADLNLVSFLFDKGKASADSPHGELIGFGVSFPSFSEALRKSKTGKLFTCCAPSTATTRRPLTCSSSVCCPNTAPRVPMRCSSTTSSSGTSSTASPMPSPSP